MYGTFIAKLNYSACCETMTRVVVVMVMKDNLEVVHEWTCKVRNPFTMMDPFILDDGDDDPSS